MPTPLKTTEAHLEDALKLIRQKNAEINDLKKILTARTKDNDTAEAIRQEIWGLSQHTPAPPAWIMRERGTTGKRGCPVSILSDIHYGEQVFGEEIDHVNEFNKNIAKKRIQRYFDTIIDLSFNHMGRANLVYPGIILCLGGDLIGGNIHEELAWTNDRTPHQAVNELTDIIAGGIDKFASKFGRIFVPGVVGNHGRSTKRSHMKHRVFHNYDWSIYCNLERYFRKEKLITIHVPNSADAHFHSYGSHFLLTHGDSLGVKGGDGIIGAIGPIMRGTLKLRNSELQLGRDVDHVLMAHWHQMLWLPGVTVNNSVKGYDEYVKLGLRAPYSRPSQALFFNHPDHGITARWEVFLEGRKRAEEAKTWVSWKE